MIICSFITNKLVFILIYAGVIGVSTGLSYMLPIECALKYYPNAKGKISGFIVCCFGISTFIFNFITLAIVNPDN